MWVSVLTEDLWSEIHIRTENYGLPLTEYIVFNRVNKDHLESLVKEALGYLFS